MAIQPHHRYWLALVTAILLLMQSFSIWHNAEHAFHIADADEAQCERFEVYGHSPTLDVVSSLSVSFNTQISVVKFAPTLSLLPSWQRDAYAIRAPPNLYS
jgi:hypothetical protein